MRASPSNLKKIKTRSTLPPSQPGGGWWRPTGSDGNRHTFGRQQRPPRPHAGTTGGEKTKARPRVLNACECCLCFLPAGCARRWCPWRTQLSQRPPPRCRNGGSCGSSSMWLVAAAPEELGQTQDKQPASFLLLLLLFVSASSSEAGGVGLM